MSSASRTIIRLLDKHKRSLSAELERSPQLVLHLASRGVVSDEEQGRVLEERNATRRAEVFTQVLASKGFNAFRELCMAMEKECPQLLTALLLDSAGKRIRF